MSYQPKDQYLNEYFTKRQYGDFTPFYVTITICCVLVAILLILNAIFCCSSQFRDYWLDSNTGNRLIAPLWTRTPHNQTSLDYAELEGKGSEFTPPVGPLYSADYTDTEVEIAYPSASSHYSEHRQYYHHPSSSSGKKESDI